MYLLFAIQVWLALIGLSFFSFCFIVYETPYNSINWSLTVWILGRLS